MGYTHSWRRERDLDATKFAAAVEDCGRVLALEHSKGVGIAGPMGDGVAELEPLGVIAFNGKGDDSYESFVVERVVEPGSRLHGLDEGLEGMEFAFCKTAHRPYDLAVMTCLMVLKHHLGRAIRIGSDGGIDDWLPAIGLAEVLLDVKFGTLEFADDGGGWQSLEPAA